MFLKGIIFLKLEEFVDATFGEFAWDEILLESQPASEGAYTANTLYEDTEFFLLFETICKRHNLDPKAAQFSFGQWVFSKLLAISPSDIHATKDTFGFLRAVNDVIHIEVMKIHPDALLPEFEFLSENENTLVMQYISPRGLCYFCSGLIDSLAKHLNEKIKIDLSINQNDGEPQYIFELTKL